MALYRQGGEDFDKLTFVSPAQKFNSLGFQY